MFSQLSFILLYPSREVAKAVARIISLALDLGSDFFDRPEVLSDPIAILRLLHYEGETNHKGCTPLI